MISSGSDNRKKKATRRQVLSLAGGATLALGTLGMMTFGAAAAAYAQAPAQTTTLSGNITIGSPSATPALPTLNQSNAAPGATNNDLSFTTTAPVSVSIPSTDTTGSPSVAAELKLSGPYSLAPNAVAEVIDTQTKTVLGSLTTTGDQSNLTANTATVSSTDVYAPNSTDVINKGDTLTVIIDNVVNSTTPPLSGDVSLTLGTMVSGSYHSAGTAALTASATVKSPVTPTLSLSPANNPGQLTNLTYTFQVLNPIASTDTFTVDLADTPLSGSVGYPTPNTSDVTLSVNGTSETSNVSAATGSVTTGGRLPLVLTVNSGTLASGVYTLSVPIHGSATADSGIENVTAQYVGSATPTGSLGGAAFVTGSTPAAWGYPLDLTSVSASDPYASASSTVTIDFTSLSSTDVPLTVAGLGLSGNAGTQLATLTDTTTGADLGAVVFSGSTDASQASVGLTSGDAYSLTFTNLPLPSASTTVSISNEFAPPVSTTLNLGPVSATQMQVSASTTSTDTTSNWTLSGIEAATSFASGNTLQISQAITGTAGTGYSYMPTASGAYKVVDLSNSADTQTPSSVSVSGGTVTLTLASAIPSGDVLELTITGVVNNPVASTATVSLSATTSGDYLETAQLTAPSAASSKANGSIANASGALYEWAGGYAFHLPTVADAGKIEASKSWPTQQKVSVPSTSIFASGDALTMGTLVQGVQSGTVLAPIYVVGSNGDLYHIASPTAFYGGGYSTKNVVEIPQSDLAMMTMASSGSATPSAASVHSDGSFWQASGSTSIYEWVGGVAVHIASPTDLVSIAHSMGETLMASWPQVSASSVPTSEMAPSVPMMGTLVKVLDGSSAGSMYVSTGTALVPISAAQVSSLGYPGSDVLEVSTLAGIPVL
ncbi:beta strand repeat-containing protein [Ferrimicrobium acidiphilum]|uniref:beta strand repeat-containing protein n=1 Tax=Ferrimicrobium acidiphilum TaxID=121039 RepID=UPI00055190C2|nr:hypothetical protein [Ferrimicrobium acidiphilum]